MKRVFKTVKGYYLIYSADTCLAISAPDQENEVLSFGSDEGRSSIALTDWRIDSFHQGLKFIIFVQAPSLDRAKEQAFNHIAIARIILCFITGIAVPEARYVMGFSDEKSRYAEITAAPHIGNTIPWGDYLLIDRELSISISEKLKAQPSSLIYFESLRWWFCGQKQGEPSERFISWWIALMRLIQPLEEKYSADLMREKRISKSYPTCANCEQNITICNNCNEDCAKEAAYGEIESIRFFIKSRSLGSKADLDEMYRLRSKLVKTGQIISPDDTRRLTDILLPLMRKIYMNALFDLLELDDSARTKILSQKENIPYLENTFRIEGKGRISWKNECPSVEIEGVTIESSNSQGNFIAPNFEVRFKDIKLAGIERFTLDRGSIHRENRI